MPTAGAARRCCIRFAESPDSTARARLDTASAGFAPAPGLHWEAGALHVEYGFPACSFEDIWNMLRDAGLDRRLGAVARLRCSMRALLEHNEREFLRRPPGWRHHVDRLYLSFAEDPAKPARRGGRLWRKHEVPDRAGGG
jgi:hypothetical protein